MANLQNDYPDDQPQPATPSTSMPLHNKSTAKERSDANRTHHQELATHLLKNAVAVGHGHFVGRQGSQGHVMPANDAHLQSGQYIPAKADMYAKDGGVGADRQPAGDDYGIVGKD